jgi:hypothetical protein
LAEARQHGFSLATLDQPLAKSFAAKRGWWICRIEMDATAKQFLEERGSTLKF